MLVLHLSKKCCIFINFLEAQKGYIFIEYIQIAQITVPELPWIQASALSYIISGHSQEVYKRKKRVTAEGKYSKDSGTNTLKVIEDEK